MQVDVVSDKKKELYRGEKKESYDLTLKFSTAEFKIQVRTQTENEDLKPRCRFGFLFLHPQINLEDDQVSHFSAVTSVNISCAAESDVCLT